MKILLLATLLLAGCNDYNAWYARCEQTYVVVFGVQKPMGPGTSVYGPFCREAAEDYAEKWKAGTVSRVEPLFHP